VSLVEVERLGDVCLIGLNRPDKLNAVSTELEAALLDALGSSVVGGSGAVVVTGSGRAFSAGADVGEVRSMSPETILAYYRASGRVYQALAGMSQPTVSAVHGYCLGAGFELALACDFRVADETARLGCPEAALGILPGSGAILRLVRACGPLRARELILLGRRIDAAQALSLGLVTDVVPAGTAVERAVRLAGQLAELPPAMVQVGKRTIDVAAESSSAAVLLLEELAYATLNATGDAADRQARFGSGPG
jgi:enoyl-CoA hydratase/carnithine racemase